MVVLVDERPEEVTDFERSVKGEVIASTFDRPPADHTIVAELAIERAKRLVELGHDVVVLLDGLTRLGRAYNLAAPASGRILAGGVDSSALHPPKRFFGAARNLENGGSLTILATALVESGSRIDEVIFEEFKSTGNMELRLRRDLADEADLPGRSTRRRPAPAARSSSWATRSCQILWKLRRVLSGPRAKQALELLVKRLRKSQTNNEFLSQVQQKTPTLDDSTADPSCPGSVDEFRPFLHGLPRRCSTGFTARPGGGTTSGAHRGGRRRRGHPRPRRVQARDPRAPDRHRGRRQLRRRRLPHLHPDLAVLDVMMPGLTGLEAVREIRDNPALKDIPVILLTARAQQSDVQTGYDSGADDYITKPFSPKDLASRVEALLAAVLTYLAELRHRPDDARSARGVRSRRDRRGRSQAALELLNAAAALRAGM